ncbi:MAG: adenylyl-sulfate kinase [Chloroflexota bacterium]|nr:adenylyl-sulfate kinase [Chloroflexota bacterium]
MKHAFCSRVAGIPHQVMRRVVEGIDPLWHCSTGILTDLCNPLRVDCFVWVQLSTCLVFRKKNRETNIRRIGYVASKIVRHVGVAVCAAVSPCRATRNDIRNMVGKAHYVDVFIDTPAEVNEQRDFKDLDAKACSDEIKGSTGIDDPHEDPITRRSDWIRQSIFL